MWGALLLTISKSQRDDKIQTYSSFAGNNNLHVQSVEKRDILKETF